MTRGKLPFAILKPTTALPSANQIHLSLSSEDLDEFFQGIDPNDVVAFDIETKGNEAFRTESVVVGFSLADKRGAGYWEAKHWKKFLDLAIKHDTPLIAHNVFFDGAYFFRDAGYHPNWQACTYGLYKQAATEGWDGQRWGLKNAQKELLGWKQTNEIQLNKWLVDNGYYTSSRTNLDDVVEKEDWFYVPDKTMWCKADKGEMWRAPADILGYYCALDAWSTYALYTKILQPALDKFKILKDYHEGPFLNLVQIHIEQMLSGFAVNAEGLYNYSNKLYTAIEQKELAFFELPEVKEAVSSYNQTTLQAHLDKEPPKFTAKSAMPKEPKTKYRKDGKISKLWLKWKEMAETWEPEPSKRWVQWDQKRQVIEDTNHFNLNSNNQLSWLFYDKLEYPIALYTKKGNPATDSKAMQLWGEPGKCLIEHGKLTKEKTYVDAALGYQVNNVIHPQFRVPGTLSGRLSGAGNFNVQQQPKTREYLELLHARPGHVWVDFDYVALEPSVLTELSRDSNMLKIYGPGVPKNDIYIFVGAHIPGIKEVFTSCGYDPHNPTRESIATIKKQHKTLRSICKILVLSAQYGAGAKKIWETLKLQGVDKTLDEVYEIHKAYWDLYKGIKEYEDFLKRCHRKNGGWILNGIGRPIGVHADYIKDIVNRVVQSTGHDIHMIGLQILRRRLQEKNLKYSWVIADFHDEAILEVQEDSKDKIIETFWEMQDELNELLKPYVPVKIDPAVGTSLADFKIEG